MAARYVSTARYAYNFDKKYGTLVRYALKIEMKYGTLVRYGSRCEVRSTQNLNVPYRTAILGGDTIPIKALYIFDPILGLQANLN